MDEQAWLLCDDSIPMLEFLETRIPHPFDSLCDSIDPRRARTGGSLSRKGKSFRCFD
jgi:hypothetical protein